LLSDRASQDGQATRDLVERFRRSPLAIWTAAERMLSRSDPDRYGFD
jgi:hypothetical protein